MQENNKENNHVKLVGYLKDKCKKSHTLYNEVFYSSAVKVERLSGMIDEVPITLSEKLCDVKSYDGGECIEVLGQFRSYNRYIEGKNKLVLTVYVRQLIKIEGEVNFENNNSIGLQGYICKEPLYRTTPFGREITDLLIAVNRAYNKSDYIPCICWGGNARYASQFKIGDCVKINGRIQSRAYQKKGLNEVIDKVAYELSVSTINKI